MEYILSRYLEKPVEMTYVGIGSAPFLQNEQLDGKRDQLIPHCFHSFLFQDKRPMRILLFDPIFPKLKEFLDIYFTNVHAKSVEFEGGLCWSNDVLEVYILPEYVNYVDHFWFFESLVETVLNTKGKLVVQEYTGRDLQELNTKLYEVTENKEKYKRRILLDMTFGTDSGCGTDMIKAQPFYDYSGDFLNLYFLKPHEVKRWIAVSDKLDCLLKQKYKGVFLQTLNDLHVDYRRVRMGDPPRICDKRLQADTIMEMLQKQLREIFELLLMLRVVRDEDQQKLEELFQNYKTHDPYKWYSSVVKILPN